MSSLIWHRLGVRLRLLVPGAVTLGAVLISVVPWGASGLPESTPFYALMAVYHWSIYRPELLPAPAVFVIGVIQDGLTGGPLGLSALILVVVYGVVMMQRRTFLGKSFSLEWFGFSLVVLGSASASWLFFCLYHTTLTDPVPLLLQSGITLALYPCVVWVMVRITRSALRVS